MASSSHVEPPSIAELRCPTCGAVQQPSAECRRCRCDLGLLIACLEQEQAAEREEALQREQAALRRSALRSLSRGDVPAALSAAEQLAGIAPPACGLPLLAVCQSLAKDWPAAERTYQAWCQSTAD